jgi:hypothetical protein
MVATVLFESDVMHVWCGDQGENNAFQCHGANSTEQDGKNSGGPLACGSVEDKTGYACMMGAFAAHTRASVWPHLLFRLIFGWMWRSELDQNVALWMV